MKYKTITLELLEQYQELAKFLKTQRLLLQTVENLAAQLRERYLAIQADLQATRPGGESSGTCLQPPAIEMALEMAIEELQIRMMEFSERPFDDPDTVRQFAELLHRRSLRE